MNRRQLLRYGMFGIGAAALGSGGGSSGRARQSAALDEIERVVIHPAIGIARVGNSPDGWFLGPEVPGPQPVPEGGFKDDTGRIKRQAARFRLYGLDGDGNVVQEITAADADIRWTARLANTKAAWYEFTGAFDLPAARGLPPAPGYDAPPPARAHRRNVTIEDGASLVIDPGERSIEGPNANADSTFSVTRLCASLAPDIA